MKIITVESLTELLKRHGFDNYMRDLVKSLKRDFKNWHSFTKMPRPTMHVQDGVLELMPICDNEKYYTFKYVNCHPKNPIKGKMTIVATGQLVSIDSGYPLMFCEMTILTALRTAATTAVATDLMARKNAEILAIIGTGAQAEFQILAMQSIRTIKEVRFFDTDSYAMDKFERNMKNRSFKLVRCRNAKHAVTGADIITVCTANRVHKDVIKNDWLKSGVHVNALGGDSPGKTELDLAILKRSLIVVEYFEQSFTEGEIQRLNKGQAKKQVYELYEIVTKFLDSPREAWAKRGREKMSTRNTDITLFDSVGIALEDYSVLRLTYELAEKYNIGEEYNLIPVIKNPKDLISTLSISKNLKGGII